MRAQCAELQRKCICILMKNKSAEKNACRASSWRMKKILEEFQTDFQLCAFKEKHFPAEIFVDFLSPHFCARVAIGDRCEDTKIIGEIFEIPQREDYTSAILLNAFV